jgi:hypothetical protein
MHLRAPLEKISDPNTLSNYDNNIRNHYNQSKSELPLRDYSAYTSTQNTITNLGNDDLGSGESNILAFETIKAKKRPFSDRANESAHSDPVDNITNRQTRDWKFPTMVSAISKDPIHTLSTTGYEQRELAT